VCKLGQTANADPSKFSSFAVIYFLTERSPAPHSQRLGDTKSGLETEGGCSFAAVMESKN
jgi:hypothetical protein